MLSCAWCGNRPTEEFELLTADPTVLSDWVAERWWHRLGCGRPVTLVRQLTTGDALVLVEGDLALAEGQRRRPLQVVAAADLVLAASGAPSSRAAGRSGLDEDGAVEVASPPAELALEIDLQVGLEPPVVYHWSRPSAEADRVAPDATTAGDADGAATLTLGAPPAEPRPWTERQPLGAAESLVEGRTAGRPVSRPSRNPTPGRASQSHPAQEVTVPRRTPVAIGGDGHPLSERRLHTPTLVPSLFARDPLPGDEADLLDLADPDEAEEQLPLFGSPEAPAHREPAGGPAATPGRRR